MAVSAVFACVRLLAETLGSLPIRIYRRDQSDPRSKTVAWDHELWECLHDRPNRWQTSMEWRETGMTHLCLRGNFYNRITRRGGEWSLEPLNPDRVSVDQLSDG
jgi:HK97 family phage portal protein